MKKYLEIFWKKNRKPYVNLKQCQKNIDVRPSCSELTLLLNQKILETDEFAWCVAGVARTNRELLNKMPMTFNSIISASRRATENLKYVLESS